MRQVELGNTGIKTSQLGFGCVALTMHNSHDNAVRVLEHALSQGVTHYDVARAYGSGEAETILGKFLKGKRDRVTVTTKFGIVPPKVLSGSPGLKNLARQLSRRFAFVRRLAIRVMAKTGAKENAFGPGEAAASLEASLCELQTDYVDIFTLHQGTPADARRDDLIAFLNQQVQAGKIRAWGVSSSSDKLGYDAAAYPEDCRFLQCDHNTLHPNLSKLSQLGSRGTGIFSVLRPMRFLGRNDDKYRALTAKYGLRIGADLSDSNTLVSLLLNDSVAANRNGVTLISTKHPEHLAANVGYVERQPYSSEQLRAFSEFVHEAKLTAGDD